MCARKISICNCSKNTVRLPEAPLLAACSEQKWEQVFLVSSQTPPSGEVGGFPQVKEADSNLYFLCSDRKPTDIAYLKLWPGTNSSGKECFQHTDTRGICGPHTLHKSTLNCSWNRGHKHWKDSLAVGSLIEKGFQSSMQVQVSTSPRTAAALSNSLIQLTEITSCSAISKTNKVLFPILIFCCTSPPYPRPQHSQFTPISPACLTSANPFHCLSSLPCSCSRAPAVRAGHLNSMSPE